MARRNSEGLPSGVIFTSLPPTIEVTMCVSYSGVIAASAWGQCSSLDSAFKVLLRSRNPGTARVAQGRV